MQLQFTFCHPLFQPFKHLFRFCSATAMDHRIVRWPILSFVFRTSRAIPIASAKEDPAMMERAFDEVARALEALPPDDVRLLHDAFYAGFSHSELAEREGTPLGTLKSRLRRALLKARDVLAPDPEGAS